MSWYSFLVTTVGSTVAESAVSDDDDDDDDDDNDDRLRDWGAKATPEPTDDAAIEAKNAARFVGEASMVFQYCYGSMLLILPLKSDPLSLSSFRLSVDSLIRTSRVVEWYLNGATVMLVFVVQLLSLTRSP